MLRGMMMGREAVVCKDNGCNTNVLSREFVKRNRQLLKIQKRKSIIRRSSRESIKTVSKIVMDADIEIGKHRYRSTWVVANCRYDALFGMPWHVENNPDVDTWNTVIAQCV